MEERRYWANINETAIEQHRKTKRQQWSTCSLQQWKGETICEAEWDQIALKSVS